MKIQVVGNKGCSRCNVVKDMLTNKGVSFKYTLLSETEKSELEAILVKAKEKGMESLPILIIDGEVKTLQEVLELCK